ncbi:glycosyltransferase family 9 protein [Egbenema bharatensis]|uniref:glycosyltransferase family 9 protein n=1 Tax=Egbenema bharatensis TaxID=3463334 RepID=UPI003A87D2A8
MRPEVWQTVHRLFLYCDPESGQSIAPVVRLVRCALPHAEITLWLAGDAPAEVWRVPNILIASMAALAYPNLIENLQRGEFDAAILFTAPGRSPYAMAYLCFLAGISVRVGQSQEFGGGVLTHCVKPPIEPVSAAEYQRYLLQALGFAVPSLSEERTEPPQRSGEVLLFDRSTLAI